MYLERWALVALIALSTTVTGILSLAAWRRRQNPLGQVLFLFAFVVTIYTFGYMCELASNTLEAIRFWLRVESLGIAFLPTLWIALAVHQTRTETWHWSRLQPFCLMLSTITFILSNTSEFHHLHYGPLRLNPNAPFPVAAFEPGPWYWVHALFINLALLLGNILYARAWMKTPSDRNRQAFVLFLGSLFPWIVYLLYMVKLIPWGIDPLPIALLVPGLLYTWATFGMKMLEISPIARKTVFQKLSDGILVFDRYGLLADYNAAATRAFPELTENAKSTQGRDLLKKYAAMLKVFDGPSDDPQTIWLENSGESVNYQLQRIELHDEDGYTAGFMVVVRDITNFATIMEGLRLQASIDPLTKAWNRSRWQEDGEMMLTRARRQQGLVSFILADLDDFKRINDTYGHPSGDAVLTEFARICRKNLRSEDILGRYGGDEFVIILPGVNKAGAAALAERLRQAVATITVTQEERSISFCASFGVVTAQGQGALSLNDLIRKADDALYQAKKAGGNRVGVYEA